MRSILRSLVLASIVASVPSCMDLSEGKRPELATHVADWRDEIIYQVLVDRFANGDAANDFRVDLTAPAHYHGGDWKGLEDHLDYIQALGVTTLWISPIVKNVETDAGVDGYHGYWAQDLTQLNPHFGDLASLRHLVRTAHNMGIKVILDIVTNHLGQLFFYDINENGQPDTQLQDSGTKTDRYGNVIPVKYITEYDPDFDPRGIQARTSLGESGPAPIIFVYDPKSNKLPAFPEIFQHAYAYHRKGRIVDYEATVKRCKSDTTLTCDQCPPEDCFDYYEQTELGDFPGGLKDVATERPDVRQAMIDAYTHWVEETDLDGFRIDTLKHVEHGFWQTFAPGVRQRLHAQGKDNFLLFGESFDGNDARNGSYTMPGELDGVFYFSQKYQVFDDVFKKRPVPEPTSKIKALWDQRPTNYGTAPQELGTGLPPTKTLVNFLDNHDVARFLFDRPDGAALQNALLLLLTEDGILCIYYGTEQELNGGNDPANREDMWNSGYATDGTLFKYVARLTHIRRSYQALTRGDQNVIFATDHNMDEPDAGLFAFERTSGNGYALAVFNTNPDHASAFGGQLLTTRPAGSVLVDILHGGSYTVGDGGDVEIQLDPESGTILVPQEQVVPGL